MPEGIGILRESRALEAIETEWRALWEADPHGTPFQSPEWLLPWWGQFGQPELAAVTIRKEGRLVGLLPFYIYRDPQSGVRQLLLIGAGTSDYLDGVFAPECTAENVERGVRVLADSVRWDQGCVTQLRPESKLLGAFRSSGPTYNTDPCWRMPASSRTGLPRKIRQNVQQRRNRALREGALEFRASDVSTCTVDFERFVSLHDERWEERGQRGVLEDARVLAWHREAVPRLARAGLLRLYSLGLNGETIAAMYCLADPPERTRRSLYVYLPAFSPRYAKISPGTLLLAEAVEQAAAEGIETVDLLRGNEGYKQVWHAQPVATWGCDLAPQVHAMREAA